MATMRRRKRKKGKRSRFPKRKVKIGGRTITYRKGAFRAWCQRQGFSKVTAECIRRGLKSKNPRVRRMAALAKAFARMRGRK